MCSQESSYITLSRGSGEMEETCRTTNVLHLVVLHKKGGGG